MIRRAATVRQCAILAGGLGTRLGALTADTPKPILDVGGRPFLAWLMRHFLRFGVEEFVILTGHLSDRVAESLHDIAAHLPRPARLVISEEPQRAGTGGAVFYARDHLEERFWLCNGDSLLDANLAALLAASVHDPREVIGRIVLRQVPDASRYGVVERDGDSVTAFRERPPEGTPPGPGEINGGIYLFDNRLLDFVGPDCSLERDIMPRLAALGALRGAPLAGYFRDIGIPEDLARARRELPRQRQRPALFLDRDGVINVDHGHVGTRERFEFVPGARETIAAASALGWHVLIVTNQSGVARGFYTEDDVRTLHTWIADEVRALGGSIDDVRYCPYHPEAPLPKYRRISDCRKPAPGMILDLLRAWELDPARSLLIGDQPTDLQAAAAANVRALRFTGANLAEFVLPHLSPFTPADEELA